MYKISHSQSNLAFPMGASVPSSRPWGLSSFFCHPQQASLGSLPSLLVSRYQVQPKASPKVHVFFKLLCHVCCGPFGPKESRQQPSGKTETDSSSYEKGRYGSFEFSPAACVCGMRVWIEQLPSWSFSLPFLARCTCPPLCPLPCPFLKSHSRSPFWVL